MFHKHPIWHHDSKTQNFCKCIQSKIMTFCCPKCKKKTAKIVHSTGGVIRPGNVQKRKFFFRVSSKQKQKHESLHKGLLLWPAILSLLCWWQILINTKWPLYDDDLISMNADKDFSLEIFLHCSVPNSKERPVRQEYELWSIVDTLSLFESINIVAFVWQIGVFD